MSSKGYNSLIITAIFCLSISQTALAAIGTSTSYILDSADMTNDGAIGSSASYNITGITGDNFDGESASTSYALCTGFVEETFGDCTVAAPPPPPPPPPPPGGGGSGGSGWTPPPGFFEPVPGTTQETQDTQTPEEPLQPAEPGQPPESVEPTLESGHPSAEAQEPSDLIFFPDFIAIPLELRDQVWCSDNICYSETQSVLRAAAPDHRNAPLWPLFIIFIAIAIVIAKLRDEERTWFMPFGKKRKKKQHR